MSALAIIRPDDWNVALFVHVLAAFTLIGALVTAASYLFAARRDGSVELVRAGFRSLLIVALPALIATRLAGQWIASKEGLEDAEVTWIETGYASTDGGLLLLIGATVAAGLAVRRASKAAPAGSGGPGAMIAAWLVTLLVLVYGVITWLMASKPV
jgi:uncharacterized membrane protein